MKTIYIATPAFNGQVTIPYALSLASTISLLQSHNYRIEPRVVTSSSLLVAERNRLVQDFWFSDCEYMLCIDADLGWPAQAVMAMLAENKEFISGVYPARTDSENTFTFRPVTNADNSLVTDKHLIKMEYVPAGFMLIHRGAIAKMQDKFPELYYCPKDPSNKHTQAYCFFDTQVWEGEFWGEDYVFCRRAREAGIEIWCDPLIEFEHGNKRGMLLSVLQKQDGSKIILGKEQ